MSMSDMHLGALEVTLTAENWSAGVTIRTAIDGRIVNAGAQLYREFNRQHLVPMAGEAIGDDAVSLLVRTSQSNIYVAQAARTQAFLDGQRVDLQRRVVEEAGYIGHELTVELWQGATLVLEKLATLYSSRDHGISEAALEARKTLSRTARFATVMADHVRAWKHLWRRFDVHMEPQQPGM